MTTNNTISEVSICNMALARIGSTQTITSFGDDSNEAQQCLFFYPQDRDALLADFPWPWAEGYAQLAQVAGPEINGQLANSQWSRSFRYPADCIKMRRLIDTQPAPGTIPPQTTGISTVYPYQNQPWHRAVGQPYPLSYGESADSEGRLIMTDFVGIGSGLTAVYTRAVADPTQMTADFADLLAWRLAVDLSMGLAFSDTKRQLAEQMYERMVRKARASEMNAQQSDIPYVSYQSEMIRARWGSTWGRGY